MQKILVSVPNELAVRIRVFFPVRQRSSIISKLIEQELQKREMALYKAAMVLEDNDAHRQEVKEWQEAFGDDGLADDTWDPSTAEKK